MSKKIWITGAMIILLIAAGYIYLNKPKILSLISSMITEKSHTEIKIKESKTAVYLIADPTGSTYHDYAIPQIDTSFISNLADIIYQNGGGNLWLSYIDRDSKNNKVLYTQIISPPQKIVKPIRFNGETYYEYDKRIKKYDSAIKNFTRDSLNNFNIYQSDKKKYLKLCVDFLNKIYVKGSPDNQWSDVIGSLNGAFYTLNTIPDNTVKKYLVCFSDLQQDTPYLNPKPILTDIPEKTRILVINPVPGSSKMVTNKVLDLDYPERVYEYISKK